MTDRKTQKKSGAVLIGAGVFVVAVMLLFVVLAFAAGDTPNIYAMFGLLIGFLAAVSGFVQRLLSEGDKH